MIVFLHLVFCGGFFWPCQHPWFQNGSISLPRAESRSGRSVDWMDYRWLWPRAQSGLPFGTTVPGWGELKPPACPWGHRLRSSSRTQHKSPSQWLPLSAAVSPAPWGGLFTAEQQCDLKQVTSVCVNTDSIVFCVWVKENHHMMPSVEPDRRAQDFLSVLSHWIPVLV